MSTDSSPGLTVIIGAGVGGLATAVALRRRGWRVLVLEQAPHLASVGSGISLWPNAVRALDVLGLGAAARERGRTELGVGIRQPSGRWLMRPDSDAVTWRRGAAVLMHRADLIDLLRGALPADTLLTGTRISGRDIAVGGSDAVTVEFQGNRVLADLLVAADGVHSRLRSWLFPAHPQPAYAGYTTWRLVVELDLGQGRGMGAETWGRGQRFGLARLPDGRTYCYASAATDEGRRAGDGVGELAELRRRFAGWHDPIPELLAAAKPDTVIRTDVYEQRTPLPTYVAGRTVLVGDAAHAMTPDLGQGGCQALEDAVTLAAALAATRHLPAALARYDHERRHRTQRMVRAAHRIGAAAHLRSRFAVAARDGLLAALPRTVGARSLDWIVGWDLHTTPDRRR